jgi:adenine-specific DNA-methyltransferase
MAKQYKGSLSLDWYNKQKAILLRSAEDNQSLTDIPAPKINWVNRDEALFYEIDEVEGKGVSPYWVDRSDIRVKEARPLIFQKAYKAIPTDKKGSIPGMDIEYKIEEIDKDDSSIENILIKGDNLLALNTIKKIFNNKPESQKPKCIVIDPPYNTGKAFTQYDDNLELSEWLSLMRDRLLVLYEILSEDGFIWITLDDKGIFHCKILLDEIFGKNNFLGNIIWQHSIQGKGYEGKFSVHHNYILCYKKNEEIKLGLSERLDEHNKSYSNPDNDPRGEWRTGDVRNSLYRPNLIYPITTPSGKTIEPPPNGWRYSKDTMAVKIKKGEIYFSEDESRIIRKIYLIDQEGRVPETIWFDRESNSLPESFWLGKNDGTSRDANSEIKNLFGDNVFDTPKPEALFKKIIQLCTNEGDYILDSFGGSGTTYAVAQKMNRKWIGVEMGKQAEEVIVKRLKKVISFEDKLGICSDVSYRGGGSFKYYILGKSIIKTDSNGNGDFNWSLGKEFIQESFLSSYDYIIDTSIDFKEGELFADKKHQPLVGVQTIGTKKRVAVITLNEPKGKLETLSYEEMQSIYKTVKKKFTPEYINIFTNRGIEIAYDSKPDDLEVVKIPNAIFAELEK